MLQRWATCRITNSREKSPKGPWSGGRVAGSRLHTLLPKLARATVDDRVVVGDGLEFRVVMGPRSVR